MTTKVSDKPKGKAGRKSGQKPYTAKQKASALTILDFFEGNVSRAAQISGVNRHTLHTWRSELEVDTEEVKAAYSEGNVGVVETLKKLIECLCTIVLIKAQDASVRDLYYLMGIILDKIENLSKLTMVAAAHAGVTLPPAPPQEQLPPSIDAELKKAHWESVVEQVIAEAEKDCEVITREQAVEAICKSKPEAREYLM